jgi:Uma2 family endonuclease
MIASSPTVPAHPLASAQARARRRAAGLGELATNASQCEVVDGSITSSPWPTAQHQRAAFRLAKLLDAVAPTTAEVLPAFGFRVDLLTSVVVDIAVLKRPDPRERHPRDVLLAVEVLSPSSRRIDRTVMARVCADAGVSGYWIIDLEEPSVTAYELVIGDYVRRVHVVGDRPFLTTDPFPLTIVPSTLIDDRPDELDSG